MSVCTYKGVLQGCLMQRQDYCTKIFAVKKYLILSFRYNTIDTLNFRYPASLPSLPPFLAALNRFVVTTTPKSTFHFRIALVVSEIFRSLFFSHHALLYSFSLDPSVRYKYPMHFVPHFLHTDVWYRYSLRALLARIFLYTILHFYNFPQPAFSYVF